MGSQICHPEEGLGVSRHFVSDVMRRFDATDDVATRPGADHGLRTMERRALSRADSWHIIHLLISSHDPQGPARSVRDEYGHAHLVPSLLLRGPSPRLHERSCAAIHAVRLGHVRCSDATNLVLSCAGSATPTGAAGPRERHPTGLTTPHDTAWFTPHAGLDHVALRSCGMLACRHCRFAFGFWIQGRDRVCR